MQPVPQVDINKLHKAHGSISKTLAVFNAVESDNYIPLEELLDTVKHMAASIPAQRRDKVSGYVFGSGRVNYDEKKPWVSYQNYVTKLTNDEFGLASIGETQAHQFLTRPELYAHIEKTVQATGYHLDADDILHGYMKSDGKREPGIWDDVSRRYAQGASGHIVTVSPNSDPNRIMVQTELPVFIENANIETINGLPAELFVDAYDALENADYEPEEIYPEIDYMLLQGSSIEFMRRYSDEFSCDLGTALRHDFSKAITEEFRDMLDSVIPIKEMTYKPLAQLDCTLYGHESTEYPTPETSHH